jgi:hypothetical protein
VMPCASIRSGRLATIAAALGNLPRGLAWRSMKLARTALPRGRSLPGQRRLKVMAGQQFSFWLKPRTSSVMAGHLLHALLHADRATCLQTLDTYPGQMAGSRPAMTMQAMVASK